MTVDTFKKEIDEALKAFDKYIICLEKTPEQCRASLSSLMKKAIKAYENRDPSQRHGIALDRQVTIILSQTDGDRPLCGIYFNLHSPYGQDKSRPTDSESDQPQSGESHSGESQSDQPQSG